MTRRLQKNMHWLPADRQAAAPALALQLRMEADAVARTDPVPAVMQLLADTTFFERHRSDVFAILRELLTNAIDHGLLGLDSSLKATQDGFVEYYRLRDVRLRSLRNGHITLRVTREPARGRGWETLRIAVSDSGAGFDHVAELARAADPDCASRRGRGRGIAMLRALCEELTYTGTGNVAEVVYRLAPPTA
jgi:anti-sigma regulatory factor (Ser/Thr protein kinase)